MKISTYNCNSVRSRLEPFVDWLQEHRPDAIALQETKVVDELFPADAFSAIGYESTFCGQKSYNGVAWLTRGAPEASSFGLGDDDGESGPRLAYIKYDGVHLINTYVPQGRALDHEMFAFKLEWFRRLRRWFEETLGSSRARAVWVGDLNVAPEAKDVHDSKKIWPHVCHCQEVIDAFSEACEFGFEDVFRKHLPEEGVFTYWDYRTRNAVDRGIGWRIDHVLATPSVAKRSKGCEVDVDFRKREKPSDHTVVTATFALE